MNPGFKKLFQSYCQQCVIVKHSINFAKHVQNIQKMSATRAGEQVSAQIGKMGTITGLQDNDFALPDGQPFNIKNDNTEPVVLSIQLAGMNNGEFVTTRFDSGWNPEIVKTVKQTSLSSINLKWGY